MWIRKNKVKKWWVKKNCVKKNWSKKSQNFKYKKILAKKTEGKRYLIQKDIWVKRSLVQTNIGPQKFGQNQVCNCSRCFKEPTFKVDPVQ